MGALTFYFDRTFGKRLPQALHSMNPPVNIRWHNSESFRPNMPDDEWLGIVGPKRWVVLTQDRHFHTVPIEAAAIKQHGVRCFYLPCASQTRWVSLCSFIRRYEKLIHMATDNAAPFIFELKSTGRFKKIKLP